ncbi:MAG: LPS export ABC transporter periplasmic protein LptC [Gemmatimonadales bacterium]
MLWAVAGCTQTGVTTRETGERADSADQIMMGMITQLTENGVLRSYVEADTAYLYQNQQVTDLRGLRIRLLDAQGNQTSTLTARQGTYSSVNGKLDARGNVVVETTDGRRLRTQHLIYDKVSNRVESDSAFTYESPSEQGSGSAFRSDIEFKNLEVNNPRGFQKGKGILIPRPGGQ